MENGYFNFTTISEFNASKYATVHAAYKKKLASTNQSEISPKDASAGGELASEQMAELAQEMLETDQRVEQDREDPVLSMNNLKDMPFADFLILHKIYPKIFMLEMDSKQMHK